MGVDNAIVEMDANEPPIGDGSAQVLRRSYQESRCDRSGGAATVFRRARTDARGIENRCAACFAAG